MGSYCEIYFDDINILSYKSKVPECLISLFQETDKLTLPHKYEEEFDDGDAVEPDVVYRTSRTTIIHRLELSGFTLDRAERDFAHWRQGELEYYREAVEENEHSWAKPDLELLTDLDFMNWMSRVPRALKTRYERPQDYLDAIDEKMKDIFSSYDWLFFDWHEPRSVLRLILEAMPEIEAVTLDISDLVHGGYLEDDVQLCSKGRSPEMVGRHVLEPIVIMAEGKSDIRVLRQSLLKLFPEVAEYFTFLDHRELQVDGGANYLFKFLKAFSSTRISALMVALFDNDTAGNVEREKALRAGLASNLLVLRMPDIALARKYPTVGPQGSHSLDINGKACGIELYLGQQNLRTEDGSLMPIRWTQYFAGARAYQGELLDKDAVQEKFFRELDTVSEPDAGKSSLPELVLLWEQIFEAVRQANASFSGWRTEEQSG